MCQFTQLLIRFAAAIHANMLKKYGKGSYVEQAEISILRGKTELAGQCCTPAAELSYWITDIHMKEMRKDLFCILSS